MCLTATHYVERLCLISDNGDLSLHRSDLVFCIFRTNAAGDSFGDLQHPDPRVFPGDAVCAGTQQCYSSDIADQCWPNYWRSSTLGRTEGIRIHQSNVFSPDMASDFLTLI